MFERFTDRARRVTVLAQEAARSNKNWCIEPAHVLYGIIQEGETDAAKVLNEFNVKVSVEAGEKEMTGHIPFHDDTKRLFEFALREGLQLGHNWVGTEHMLLAFLRLHGELDTITDLFGPASVPLMRKRMIELISERQASSPPAPPTGRPLSAQNQAEIVREGIDYLIDQTIEILGEMKKMRDML